MWENVALYVGSNRKILFLCLEDKLNVSVSTHWLIYFTTKYACTNWFCPDDVYRSSVRCGYWDKHVLLEGNTACLSVFCCRIGV